VSIPSSDSSPRSAWEALACGCPLVVSDLPWVHELIEPDRHAAVVPIDADAVAAAIERLLTEPQLASRLRAEGRALVEEHRDRDAEMARLAGTYAALAGAGQPGASAPRRRAIARNRS
jgi:glycosyltransferase involved in cell wall biosynthesis